MALPITARAEREAQKTKIEPQLVLEIEGVATLFGAVEILRIIKIGDPGLLIGNTWRVGGLTPVENQADIISFEQGGGTSIDQQLMPDKGSVSSISSVQLALVDRNLIATRLISPGVVIDEILGAKCVLRMGFKNTAYPQDYVPIMAGIIDDVESGAGVVKLNIAHPEQLKRQEIFNPIDTLLGVAINSSQTSITLLDASALPVYVLGPSGAQDTAITHFVQIEDEIIEYSGITGNALTGCLRGALGTVAASHSPSPDPIAVRSITELQDTAMALALKIMLSGKNDFYLTALPVTRFLHPDPFTTLPGSVFFEGIDLNAKYGVTVGDYLTTAGSAFGANNVAGKIVQDLVVTDSGSYIIVGDVSFVEDPGTTATISFRSQFDTLGYGLAMSPDQVDVNEHVYWNNFQLAAFQYRFVFTDKVNGKDFLDKEVYMPIGAYSLPRQGRCSMGYHVGPVVRDRLVVLSKENIKNPDKIRLRRTVNRNFYNAITYKFDKLVTSDKFVSGAITFSAESKARIKVGNKVFPVESSGLRRALDGQGIAERISSRYLGRYKFAAEFFEAVGILFKSGYALEPGDIVMLDPADLKISNTEAGDRKKAAKVFTVTNKRIDLKTGDVQVALTDTNFDESERYGAISPSSEIVSGTTTSLVIRDSFGVLYPGNEARKWEDYEGLPIRVHSPDFTFDETVTFQEINLANRYELLLDPATPLSSPPAAGYIIEIGEYPDTAEPNDSARYKAVHSYLGATVDVATGVSDTAFTVAPGDVGRFVAGSGVRVHSLDYTQDSGELEVVSVVGVTVTVSATMGFTPDNTFKADGMDFPDGAKTYRFF